MNKTELDLMEVLNPTFNNLGYDIVKLNFHQSGGFKQVSTLQILIEKLNGDPITIEDCAIASREIATVIDVKELVATRYNLEISSAGINRPLVFVKDFVKYLGQKAKIKLKMPIMLNNKEIKHLKGIILEAFEEKIVLQVDLNPPALKPAKKGVKPKLSSKIVESRGGESYQNVEIMLAQIHNAELDVELKI